MNVKKIFLFLFKLLVSGGSLYFVLSKNDMGKMFAMLKGIEPVAFFGAALIYVLSILLAAYRWKFLLPERFTVRRLFSLYMIGAFFSSFLPGVIGGDVVKAYYLNKDAKKLSLTLASIFMDRYLGYVGLMLIGIIAFPFSIGFFHGSAYQWLMPAIVAAFIVASFLFFGLQLGRRFRVVSEFYDYFVTLKGKKDVIVKVVLISVVLQLMGFAAVAILAAALGEDIPVMMLFVILPIIITITTLPISISGLGVRETAFVALLGLIGINREMATSLSLAWFFSVFTGSLPGVIAYIRHSGRRYE